MFTSQACGQLRLPHPSLRLCLPHSSASPDRVGMFKKKRITAEGVERLMTKVFFESSSQCGKAVAKHQPGF